MQRSEIAEVLNRPLSQELLARDLTRLAYVGKDGTPRNVPIAFSWNGSEVVMCRHDHRLKQRAGWKVEQLADGRFRWTTGWAEL